MGLILEFLLRYWKGASEDTGVPQSSCKVNYGHIPVKEFSFSPHIFTFLLYNSDLNWCNHNILSQRNSFTFYEKTWKANSGIFFWLYRSMNANSNSYSMSQNCPYTRYLLIREIFSFLLIFANSKNFSFHEHLFLQTRQKYLFRVRLFSPVK